MSPTAPYDCRCGKRCTAAVDHVLAMLALCQPCFDERYRRGIEAQKKAEGT